MSEWISVEDEYPKHEQNVIIKIWDDENKCDVQIACFFEDYEDYRSWTIKDIDRKGRNLIAKPTHWMPLPNPPEVK